MNNLFNSATKNWKTTLFGFIFVLSIYITTNPGSLSGFLPAELAHQIASAAAFVSGLLTFMATQDGAGKPPAPPASGAGAAIVAALLVPALAFSGCAQVAALQNNAGVQAAETAAISIGGTIATGDPLFATLAPTVVYGLTALADNAGTDTAVTGVNVAADAQLITQTVAAAIPSSTGKTAATNIAAAYVNAMNASGVPSGATGANAVLNAIAAGLAQGAAAPSAQ